MPRQIADLPGLFFAAGVKIFGKNRAAGPSPLTTPGRVAIRPPKYAKRTVNFPYREEGKGSNHGGCF